MADPRRSCSAPYAGCSNAQNTKCSNAKNARMIVQSKCIRIISEFSEGAVTARSVAGLLEYVEGYLRKDMIDHSELNSLYQIILSSAFGILKECMKNKNGLNSHNIGYCLDIISDIMGKLENKDAEDLIPFLWSINSRCIMLGSHKVVSAVELEKVIKYNTCFVNFMLSDPACRKDFFCKKRRPEVAFMVKFFLNNFCSQTVHLPIRLSIGSALLELVKPWDESLEMVAAFLPGICCCMGNLACTDMNIAIVSMALKIFDSTVTDCYSDTVVMRNEKKFFFVEGKLNEEVAESDEEGTESFEKCRKELKLLLTRICSRLVRHSDHRVRLGMLTLIYDVYKLCTVSLASVIENVLIDSVVLLLNDPYESISTLSLEVIEHLQRTVDSRFMDRLRERLYSLSNTIPAEIIARGDVSGCLKQLLGVLLAMNSACGDIVLEEKLTVQLTSALSLSLRLNVKRLRLNTEIVENDGVLDIIVNLPLLYDVEQKTVTHIATLLTKCCYNLMDCVCANVRRMEQPEELTGSYFLAAYLLRSAYIEKIQLIDTFIDTLQQLVEKAIKLLERIDIHRPSRDDLIEDGNDEQGAESCLAVVLLSFCAAAFICTPSLFLCQQMMNETLFELFKWTKSSYVMCVESAEHALRAAALASGEANLSFLCITYGKYLLPKVAVCSRSYNRHLLTPCVLSSVLDHCNSPELFGNARHVVEELLTAIDQGSQEWLILILKAILSFVVAVGKWYPDVKPEQIELNENGLDNKPPKPAFVEAVNCILSRTKHLLFSSHVPVLLVVLKVVDASLRDLHNFPDDHLPMIHQNWPALLNILQNKNLNVRVSGFQVIMTMSELSGDFLYRRFISGAWPLIRIFMLKQSTSSANVKAAYFHSAAYKYQKAVLENLATIFVHIGVRSMDWRGAEEVAEAYCHVSQPENFQISAKSLLSTCHAQTKNSDELNA